MTEETLEQFLDRRERELSARLSAIRGQLAPIEAELEKIQKTRAALIFDTPSTASNQRAGATRSVTLAMIGDAPQRGMQSKYVPAENPYAGKTIKELTIQALLDHFPLGGSASDIRDFIRDAYTRTIEPSSLRPQMHRLKADGILAHDPAGDRWDFQPGKRALYDTYRQAPPPHGMEELRDDPDPHRAVIVEELRESKHGLPWEQKGSK
jgi:hypothetical protein